jgi:hypothetical protein
MTCGQPEGQVRRPNRCTGGFSRLLHFAPMLDFMQAYVETLTFNRLIAVTQARLRHNLAPTRTSVRIMCYSPLPPKTAQR